MITRESSLGFISNNPVNRAVIVTKLRKLRLDSAYRCVWHGLLRIGIARLIVIIRRMGRIVVTIRVTIIIVVWVTVVIVIRIAGSVVRIVIPWIKSPPETVDKNKYPVVMEVSVMPVPITVPVVCVMPLGRVVLDERLTVCCS